MCGSPRLIAACHVLHRLFAPRHPPYALSSLTIKFTQERGSLQPFAFSNPRSGRRYSILLLPGFPAGARRPKPLYRPRLRAAFHPTRKAEFCRIGRYLYYVVLPVNIQLSKIIESHQLSAISSRPINRLKTDS